MLVNFQSPVRGGPGAHEFPGTGVAACAQPPEGYLLALKSGHTPGARPMKM